MTLKCRPGDLAVITHGRNRDRWVFVLERSADMWQSPAGDSWFCESATGAPLAAIGTCTGKLRMTTQGHVEDARLRPIRDPGPDAVDETLRPTEQTRKELLELNYRDLDAFIERLGAPRETA